jgi:glutamate-1-semialdehyde 2,1-aminomutase
MSALPLETSGEGLLDQAAYWKRAQSVIPRGASSGHRVGWDQVINRTSGSHVWDGTGKRYVDYLLAWGPIVLGHCDPRVNEAVAKAMSTCDLTGIGPQFGEVEVAEIICRVMPSAERVAFCTSGTDATMHAVHLARAATGRRKIVKFHGSYHGWSDVVAVGSARADSTPTTPMGTPNGGGLHPDSIADVIMVEWNDDIAVKQAFADHGHEIAAVFCEPYVHSFGCVPAKEGFLEMLRATCDAHSSVLVFDEVKTGFRSAIGGYQSICGVTPDLTAFGKAVANGFALAGLAGSEVLMGHLGAYTGDRATIDGTYNAAPYALAAARKTLEIMQTEDVFERLYLRGEQVRTGLREAAAEAGAQVSIVGLGSEWAVYFQPTAPTNFREALRSDTAAYARFHEVMVDGGIIQPAFPNGDRRLCAATSQEDVDLTIEVARRAFAASIKI